MILTNNDGMHLKVGYMEVSESIKTDDVYDKKWKNSKNWKSVDSGFYILTNFRGSTEGILFFILADNIRLITISVLPKITPLII